MLSKARSRGHYLPAAAVHKPEDVQLETMITPAMKDRISEYGKMRSKKCGKNGEFIVDLDQNAGFAGTGPLIPCIPTHSSVYSYKKERLLLGKELLSTMGAWD